MRYTKRLILFFLLFATAAVAQWRPSPYNYQYKGVKADDVLMIPVTTTTDSDIDRAGALRYHPTKDSVQVWNGSTWVSLVSGKGIGLDSARRSNDTLYFHRTTGGELAVKMDYYTKAESDERYVLSPSGRITSSWLTAWDYCISTEVPNIPNPDTKYLIVNGTAGDTAITVTGGTLIDDFTPIYVAVAFDKTGNHYNSFLVIRRDGSTFHLDRPLKYNLSADTVKFIWDSYQGQHMTNYGYRGYADLIYDYHKNLSSRDYKLYSFYPEDAAVVSPFVNINGATQGGFIPSTTIPQVSSISTHTISYHQIAVNRYLCQQGGVADRGVEWTVNLGKKNGFLETWVGVDKVLPGYAKVYFYLDGVLKETAIVRGGVQKLTFNYSGASSGKVQIVTGDIQNTSISIGRTVWHQTDLDTTSKVYTGGKILFVGDSWTQFAFTGGMFFKDSPRRFLQRWVLDGGDPADIINVGRGGMTSAWGKYWLKSWIATYQPKYCYIEFYINDANSSSSVGNPAITTWNFSSSDPYSAGTDVDGKVSQADWIANVKSMRDTCLKYGVIPIILMNTPTASGTQTQTQSAWFSANQRPSQYYDIETIFTSGLFADASITAPLVTAVNANVDTVSNRVMNAGSASISGSYIMKLQQLNSATAKGLIIAPAVNYTGSLGKLVSVQNVPTIGSGEVFSIKNNGSVTATDYTAGMTGFTIPPFTITSNAGVVRFSATNSTTLNYLYLADSFRNTIRARIPLTLQNYNTGGLPVSSFADKGSMAYDSLKNRPAYYDAFFWWSLAREEDMFLRWDSTTAKSRNVQNQFTSTQTGNYILSGIGAKSRAVLFNTASTTFQRYQVFSNDAIDTTKQLWALGLVGTPGGGPIHIGGNLLFRAYSNTGAYQADALELSRNGAVRAPHSFTAGTGVATYSGAVISAIGNIGANGQVAAASGIQHGGNLIQSNTVTVTGDYVAAVTDLYINVNNSTDCTISLPAAQAGSALNGRVIHVKKISNNASTVSIVVAGGIQTIDGISTFTLSTFNDPVTLHDNGSNWFTYTKYPTAPALAPFVSAGTPAFVPNGSTNDMLGTGYTVNITGSGNFFKIEITTGTGITTTGTIGQIVFDTPFPDDPVTVYSQTDLNAVGTTVLFSAVDGTYILMANKTVLDPSTTYTYSVHTGLIPVGAP